MITQQQPDKGQQLYELALAAGVPGLIERWDEIHRDWQATWRGIAEDLLRQYIQQSPQAVPVQAEQAAAKSLNAKAADLLRPYLKPGQKVIWREAFRWHDDNGVLPNHYEGQEVEVLSDNFGYGWAYDTNLKHAAIVWDRAAATQPQQEQSK